MSGTSNVEPDGVVSKVKVKKQIKTIVHDLETILVDLRDVAKELQEVVHEIDTLTCDLQLEEDLTDSSKTDTLNSSSSSTTTTTTTTSGDQPLALRCLPLAICPPLPPPPPPPAAASPVSLPAVLTVLRKAHPPPPPPRMASARPEERGARTLPPALPPRAPLTNGTAPPERNGRRDFSAFSSSSSASLSNDSGVPDAGPVPTLPRPMPLLRHQSGRCSQAPPGGATRERERVRFSETVQYHGYCPDCDLRYDVDDADLRPRDEPLLLLLPGPGLSPLHCCSSPSPSPPLSLPLPLPVPVPLPLHHHHHHHHHHQYHMENGGLPVSHSFPPANGPPPPSGPHSSSSSSSSSSTQKPQKTILRKSTTTTV